QIFDHDATEKLRTYFSNVCADFEAELVEMDGEPDHVHLLINYPPKLAIS
ncbi:transposase, partial [Escherichia coli]